MKLFKRVRSKVTGTSAVYYWWNLMILAYTFLAGAELAQHHYFLTGEFVVLAIFFIVLSETML